MNKLLRALRLKPRDVFLAAEAWAALAIARVLFLALPFRVAVARYGMASKLGESERQAPADEAKIHQIHLAILRATGVAPFRVVCLQQAFAAAWMLGRRGLPVEVHFGVAKDGKQLMTAHAWSLCGSTIVTGERAVAGHTRVAVFARHA